MEDYRSSGLQRYSEVVNAQKTWENRPKRCFTQENSRHMSRESSVDSYNGEQNRDTSIRSFLEFPNNFEKRKTQVYLKRQKSRY